MSLYGTKIKDNAAIMKPVVNDNCPDAKGRCGLFICMHKTCNIVSNQKKLKVLPPKSL